MPEVIGIETVVPIIPVMQPSPGITPGGDCFACATAAILNTFYPESPITVSEALELWRGRDGHLTNSCYFANEVLHKIRFDMGREIDYFPYIPLSTVTSHHNLSFRPLIDEHLFMVPPQQPGY
jgi:hypothetical protein